MTAMCIRGKRISSRRWARLRRPILFYWGELGHPGGTTYSGMNFGTSLDLGAEDHGLGEQSQSPLGRAGASILRPSPCLISDLNYTPTPQWGGAALSHLLSYRNLGRPCGGRDGDRDAGYSHTAIEWGAHGLRFRGRGRFQRGAFHVFLDAATASGAWTGSMSGVARRITRIDYMPRQGAHGQPHGRRAVSGIEQRQLQQWSDDVVYWCRALPVDTGTVYTKAVIANTGTFRYVVLCQVKPEPTAMWPGSSSIPAMGPARARGHGCDRG